MKVEDLGLGLTPQMTTPNSSNSPSATYRVKLFNFLLLYQLDSQKLRILTFISYFYSILQTIYISFWPHLDLTRQITTNKFDYIRTPPNFEQNMTTAFFFYSVTENIDNLYLNSFLIIGICFVLTVLTVLTFCFFFFKRVVNYQLLLCFNIYTQILCPIILIPLGFQIGWLISQILIYKSMNSTEETSVFTAIVVLDVILYVFAVFLIIANNVFNANSLLIAKSFLASFNGVFESFFSITPSVILMFSNFLPYFYQNFRYILVAIHMVFCVLTIIWCFWVPFGIIRANSVVSAVCFAMLISDFLCFTEMNTRWYRYLIFFGCFIAFYFLMNLLINIRIKSILKLKNKTNTEHVELKDESEDEKIKMNQNLNLNRMSEIDDADRITGFEDEDVSKALFALRVALFVNSSVFTDGKLIELILTKAQSDLDKIDLGFLICYFPEYQPIFFSLLMVLKRAQFLPFLKEYQLYQLRCFDNSFHPEANIDEVKNLILETTALEVHIQSLWQAINTECITYNEKNKIKKKLNLSLFSSFDRLSLSIFNCNSKWKSAFALYPNNIQIAEEYSNFLIRCYGDYIGASEWKTASCLMKEGKLFKFNPACESFLRAFPQYSKQIYPKKASFVNLDDVDDVNKVNNVSNIIEMPEARFEYQRSTNASYPISILVFLLVSIISFLFILIFSGHSLNTFKHFNTMTDSLDFVLELGLLGEQISKCLINVLMEYGQIPLVNLFPSPKEILDTVFEGGTSDRVNSVYDYLLIDFAGDYKSQLASEVELGMGYLDFIHLAALKQVEQGNPLKEFFSIFFNPKQENIFYLSRAESVSSISNPQSILVSFFTYYYGLTFYKDHLYLNDTQFYDETLGGNQILDILENVSFSVISNNEYMLKDIDYYNSTRLYFVAGIYILFSIISMWVTFIFIRKSFNSISNSLCYFSSEVKQKATLPMIQTPEEITERLDSTFINNVQLNIKNFVLISLAVSTLIHIALGGIIFSFHFIYIKYRKQIISCINLIHNFTMEASRIIELLYSVMAANAFGRILPSVDEKYKKRLMTVRDNFLRIHQARWSYSIEGDCGIKGQTAALINNIRNMEKCPEWPDKSYHELIACLSEESGINAFIDLTDFLINNIYDPLLMKTDEFKQYYYFINANLYFSISDYDFYFISATLDKDIDYINKNQVFAAITIIVTCMLFILNIFIFFKIREIFRLLFSFISRVNPSDIITNHQLLETLFGIKNMNKKEIQNNDTSFLVQESSLPLIFIDRSTLIEFINVAFTRKFGFEANFIVGQPISTIIDDDSILYYIDKMKFFGSKKSVSQTFLFKRGNGGKTLYDITLIPIHNSLIKKYKEKKNNKDNNNTDDDIDSDENDDSKDSFVNRIAIVFNDKNSEKNLEKKCKGAKSYIDKLLQSIYPEILNMFVEGYLRICAVCLVKLPNSFPSHVQSKNILTQYTNMYDILYEKLKIFPLLSLLYAKNEIFAVVGCRKNDPIELAIECLNFAFNVVDEFAGMIKNPYNNNFIGQIFAVVETGGELNIGWLGNETRKVLITGELINRALRVLDNASHAGTICASKTTYEYLMQNDYAFFEKEIPEEICGCNSIYSIEKDFNTPSFMNNNNSDNSSNGGASSIIIQNMKEEEPLIEEDNDD